jgi:hypothetical protein
MKLRIRGDALRVRVSQTELRQIIESGNVSDAIRFGPASSLTYRVQTGDQVGLSAHLESDVLTVTVPRSAVQRWRAPAEVSISGVQDLGDGRQLAILIEKDFACIAPRAEDQSDLFPNPEAKSC